MKILQNIWRERQFRNEIGLERCGQVRATKPRFGSGPVEWKSDYELAE
jgi:hypothetical protein